MNIEKFTFPGGEVHVRVTDVKRPWYEPGVAILTQFIRNSDDVMQLLLTTDALRRSGHSAIRLQLPYVPYARQDRVMTPGEPLSIKVFCDLINAQNYLSVTIWDPHSDVTPALLNNCDVRTQADILSLNQPHLGTALDSVVLVCPDSGARKKIFEVSNRLGGLDIIFADKVRDVRTGQLSCPTLGVGSERDYGSRDLLIVDDIADGGGSFIQLAKLLRERRLTTGCIKLYVTHGIFSKGLEVFDGIIDEIYTVNSWIDQVGDRGPGKCKVTFLQHHRLP